MPHFRVTYTVVAPDEGAARAMVDALCLEQTVELPLALVPPGRGLHSSTSELNLSALCGMGGARRGCVARVQGVLGGV